ncbi:hemicentin-1-like [Hydractinia symbiolongicarpus]|uniref:hemicentin-1-like n=1 Tax=Hydractinia symbiolongicarpus TaxID=13093 RepID=UPI00255020DD|nr:hemicentin-1-like [Hydractinia symbiolongicarpus]
MLERSFLKNMTHILFDLLLALSLYHTVHTLSNTLNQPHGSLNVTIPTKTTATTTTTTTTTTTATTTTKKMPRSKYAFVSQSVKNIYNITTFIGGKSLLDCEIMSVYQRPRITWIKDSKPLKERNFRFYYDDHLNTTFSLKFVNMMLTDVGKYECLVGNKNEVKIKKTFHIVINEPEKNKKLFVKSLEPRDSVIEVGETIKLTCKARGGNDIPKFFRWDRKPTKNGKDKSETLKVDQCSGSSVLEINNAAVGDSGVYLCFISNRRGYVVVSTRVTVKESSPNYLAIIVPIVSIILVVILGVVSVFLWRIYKRRGRRKRTHSYHYTSTSDS